MAVMVKASHLPPFPKTPGFVHPASFSRASAFADRRGRVFERCIVACHTRLQGRIAERKSTCLRELNHALVDRMWIALRTVCHQLGIARR